VSERDVSLPQEVRWLDAVVDPKTELAPPTPLIGVLPGEGIGPEVVGAARDVLRELELAGGKAVEVETGGSIGVAAEQSTGDALPEEVAGFCRDVFARGGSILTGAGGGRYVYDLRSRLDLFLKLVPVSPRYGLVQASPLRPEAMRNVDFLLVRENLGGIYQGTSKLSLDPNGQQIVRHSFETSESNLQRFLGAAARLAGSRRGHLTVVFKQSGAPALADIWRRCGTEAAATAGVDCSFIDVDLMAYDLVRRPRDFDVIAASNLAGDVLGDLTAVLVGSRGLSFSGNLSPLGYAVYQTNHGAAYDIADRDIANPVGQILSLAMLLRESLNLNRESQAIEDAVRSVWAQGLRTADIAAPGEPSVGTQEMTARIAEAAAAQLGALPRAA
jgi:3-isopropylmalate dehydrogenase